MQSLRRAFLYVFDREHGPADRLITRWLFLRSLGLMYCSAFFALLFQIRGLNGTQGMLPAAEYLQQMRHLGLARGGTRPRSFG